MLTQKPVGQSSLHQARAQRPKGHRAVLQLQQRIRTTPLIPLTVPPLLPNPLTPFLPQSIPSVHSGNHKRVGNAVVGITGGCRPAQWLPWDICFKQFYEMCVSGNGRGEQSRVYGKKRCQKWKISNPR